MKKLISIFNKFLIPGILAIVIIALGFLGLNSIKTNAETTPQFLSTLGVDNTDVRPGQDFQYTVTIKNTGTVTANNILVSLNLNPNMTYVSGSGTANKEGKTINVIDNWQTTGTNLGSLDPNKIVYLFFRAKVNDNAAVGSKLQSAVQVKADNYDWTPTAFSINVISANLTTTFQGGNFVKVANTTQSTGWRDETVGAKLGEIIEYDIYITNTGNQVAKNVHFRADLPGESQKSNVLKPKITLSADNASDVSDTVTVNVDSPTWMVYYPGHAKKFGNTGLYDCGNIGGTVDDEQGGCPIPETFYYNAENIGNIDPGASKTIQIIFKSGLVNIPSPTPTTTPTPTMTPTPTATPTVTPTPTATPTSTPSSTPTVTPTPTATPTVTPSPTPTAGPTSSCSTLTASTTNGTAPLTITFTGSGSDSNGNIQQYQFNFGDSSNGQSQIVTTSNNNSSHVYYNSGNYIANLLVEDSRGNWVGGGSCQLNIIVNAKPAVLGATAPPVLPVTGSNDGFYLTLAAIPTIIGGIYMYRRFRLI